MNLYGLYMLTRREIARYFNVWAQTLVPPIVSAGLFLFVFGHALGDRIGDFDGTPYLTFLVPGLIVMGAVQGSYSNTGSSLFDARRAGYIEDVLTSPLTDLQILFAYVVSGASRGILIGLGTLLIALPVTGGWQFNPILFAIVLAASSILFATTGLIAGILGNRWDHIFVPVTFILTPLTFLGGVFYPVSELPRGLELASRFNPILYLVDLQRYSVLGVRELSLEASFAMLGGAILGTFLIVWSMVRTSRRVRG